METLCIHTTMQNISVALVSNNKISHHTDDNTTAQSEKIFSLIDYFLKKQNITIQQIKNVCCTNGPGSFIGIRVAHSILNCLKIIDQETQIFGVSNMDILFSQFEIDDARVVLNARKDRVYIQDYLNKKKSSPITTAHVSEIVTQLNIIIDDSLKNSISSSYVGQINAYYLAKYVQKHLPSSSTHKLLPEYVLPINAVPSKKIFDL